MGLPFEKRWPRQNGRGKSPASWSRHTVIEAIVSSLMSTTIWHCSGPCWLSGIIVVLSESVGGLQVVGDKAETESVRLLAAVRLIGDERGPLIRGLLPTSTHWARNFWRSLSINLSLVDVLHQYARFRTSLRHIPFLSFSVVFMPTILTLCWQILKFSGLQDIFVYCISYLHVSLLSLGTIHSHVSCSASSWVGI